MIHMLHHSNNEIPVVLPSPLGLSLLGGGSMISSVRRISRKSVLQLLEHSTNVYTLALPDILGHSLNIVNNKLKSFPRGGGARCIRIDRIRIHKI